MASRISKPLTDWIYSSCCARGPLNSKLEFYLFLRTCRGGRATGKDAPPDAATRFCDAAGPRASTPVQCRDRGHLPHVLLPRVSPSLWIHRAARTAPEEGRWVLVQLS